MVINYAPITHNPWHPHVELIAEGRERAARDVARELVADMAEKFPGEELMVCFDGVAYAGFVPNR